MANCRQCGSDVGCSCNLSGGLCYNCRKNRTSKPVQKVSVNTTPTCQYSLLDLQLLLDRLQQKEPKNNIDKYHILIVAGQITLLDSKPCKYAHIIDRLL